ncbi:MAG: hypothetical protein HYX47_04365 [Burkholderiales bacterium]|nr:hypothetical protein [Burkholderiales bacterium]
MLLTILLWVGAASASDASPAPSKLSAFLGGTFGSTYRVGLKDATVTCQTSNSFDGKVVALQSGTPTNEQWAVFRDSLNRENVWGWKSNRNSDVRDGTGWAFEVRYDDRSVTVFGINSYPNASGEPEGPLQTPAFDALAAALRALVPGCSF